MEILKHAIDCLKDVNAKDIRIYETKSSNPFFSYVVVATAVASRQMDGLASIISEKSKEKGFSVRNIEGRGGSGWMLVDLNDVIINLFTLEERNRYDLDKLFALLPTVELE